MLILGTGMYLINKHVPHLTKSVFTEVSSATLGTEVSIQQVNISIMKGWMSLQGLSVKNPEGFSSRDMLHCGLLNFKVNSADKSLKSLEFEDILLHLEIIGPHSNISTVSDHTLNFLKQALASNPSASLDKIGSLPLRIEEITLKNIRLSILSPKSKTPEIIPINDIFINNLNTTFSELPDYLLTQLYSSEQIPNHLTGVSMAFQETIS